MYIGLYSGAGADGVDAVLAAVRGRREKMKVRQLHHVHAPYADELHRRIVQAMSGKAMPAGETAELDRDVALAFAAAAESLLRESHSAREDVLAIGSSGQATGRVLPALSGEPGCAAELGSPAVIASRTGLSVAARFAQGDLAAGGQGGPLTAWPDWLLLRDKRLSRVAVHLGGIASLTFVGSGAAADDVVAFDIGPGTLVIDALADRVLGRPFDSDGAAASQGVVQPALLNELLANPYFHRSPPKTTQAGEWGAVYLQRLLLMARKHLCPDADILATVTELSAHCVAWAVERLTERPHEVILSGGGASNIHLAGRIRNLLSPCSTYSAERYGLSLRGKQAACFAVLAAARLDAFPAHCPAATGAKKGRVLGSLWMP